MKEYILKRLIEGSTWKGIVSLIFGSILKYNDADVQTIIAAVGAVYAALAIVMPDKFGSK